MRSGHHVGQHSAILSKQENCLMSAIRPSQRRWPARSLSDSCLAGRFFDRFNSGWPPIRPSMMSETGYASGLAFTLPDQSVSGIYFTMKATFNTGARRLRVTARKAISYQEFVGERLQRLDGRGTCSNREIDGRREITNDPRRSPTSACRFPTIGGWPIRRRCAPVHG